MAVTVDEPCDTETSSLVGGPSRMNDRSIHPEGHARPTPTPMPTTTAGPWLRMGRWLFALVAILALTACASPWRKPDLRRLYLTSQNAVDQPPVILIPGIMGSRLFDATGHERWVGSLGKTYFSDYRDLALTIDPETLQPTTDFQAIGLTDEVSGRDYYASIVRVLVDAGGYQIGTPGTPAVSGRRYLYQFAYDWRLDNVESARRLDALIEQIRIDHARPDLKVDIVAHSMGGLIARYYLRYGTSDVLDGNDFPLNYHGGSRVRRIALLGTPNLGSVGSLHAFIVGRRVALGRVAPEVLATFPSMYQLFPHPLHDWIVSAEGKVLSRDLFDVELWRRFEWSIFDPRRRARVLAEHPDPSEGARHLETLERYFGKHIERGRRFVWSLTVPIDRAPWSLMTFGGDCDLTPARVLVEDIDGESRVRLDPRDIDNPLPGVDYDWLMLEPGDGTVTKASLLARDTLDPFVPRHRYIAFPVAGSMFLCERHDRLSANISFQDNLLQFLLNRDPAIGLTPTAGAGLH